MATGLCLASRHSSLTKAQHAKMHAVYEKVSMSQCWKDTGNNPIQTGWGHEQGNVRVSEHEISMGRKGIQHCNLFSATSPLEGVKLVISEAASSNQKGTVLLVIAARRAYFYAKATRRVYVELPEGDGGRPDSQQCGMPKKSLYGTELGARAGRILGGNWLAQRNSKHMFVHRRNMRNHCFDTR